MRLRDRTLAPRSAFAAACAGTFVFGATLATLGSVLGLPDVRDRLVIGPAQQGDLFALFFLGMLASTLVIGPLIERFGAHPVAAVSMALVAAASLLLSNARGFGGAAASALILGVGGGGANIATNVIVADLYQERRAVMLNLFGIFFGLGAVSMPLMLAGLGDRITVRGPFIALATFATSAALLLIVTRSSVARQRVGFSFAASRDTIRTPGVPLGAAILFFQSATESTVGAWTSTYLGTMGASPRTATWVLTIYWTALIAGRLVTARLQPHMSAAVLVAASAAVSGLGCALLLTSASFMSMAAGASLAGFSFAAVFPVTLAFAADRAGDRVATAFGLLFTAALIGGMVVPWAIGRMSQTVGLQRAMVLPLLSAAAVAMLAPRLRAR